MVKRLMTVLLLAVLIAAVSSVGGVAEADEPDYADSEVVSELIAQYSPNDRVKLSENDNLRVPDDPKESIEYRLESLNIYPSTGQHTTTQEGTVRFGLPATGAHEAASINDKGELVHYSGDSYSIAVGASQNGFASYVVINDETAPNGYDFDIDLPSGFEMVEDGSGGVQMLDEDGNVIGAIAAPWAFDANGAPIPTRFEVSRGGLIQTVEHRGAAYPVVADPDISFGWGIYLRWNLSEDVEGTLETVGSINQVIQSINCVAGVGTGALIGAGLSGGNVAAILAGGAMFGAAYCESSQLVEEDVQDALDKIDDDLPDESFLTDDCTLMTRHNYAGFFINKVAIEECSPFNDVYYDFP